MNTGSICQVNVVTIAPGQDLAAAARLMREKHVGYLVVAEETSDGRSKVSGVLTDRDIVVAVVAREVDPRSLRVGDVMTRNPLLADVHSSVEATLRHMRDVGVRRVPVVDENGSLAGVLSLDDVIDHITEQLSNIAGSIRNEQRVERAVRV